MRKVTITIVALALFCEIPVSLEWSEADGPFVSFNSAQAVIGRPVTPGSVAGVARRTTRRTVRRAVVYCTSAYRPAGCVWR